MRKTEIKRERDIEMEKSAVVYLNVTVEGKLTALLPHQHRAPGHYNGTVLQKELSVLEQPPSLQ